MVNAHASEAPPAQPRTSFAGRSLIAAVPRFREAPGWAKARLAAMATAALEHFGRDAIAEYARTVQPGMFKERQHIPEFRHALRLLGQAVTLGHACRNCGKPPADCPCRSSAADPVILDTPWTEEDHADWVRVLEELGLTEADLGEIQEA